MNDKLLEAEQGPHIDKSHQKSTGEKLDSLDLRLKKLKAEEKKYSFNSLKCKNH